MLYTIWQAVKTCTMALWHKGKIEAIADVDGLFKVDVDRLHAINSIGELTIVTKFNNTPVKQAIN